MLDLNDVGRCVRIGVAFIILLLSFRFVLRPTLVDGQQKESDKDA
jgi:hypothetical protein